MWKPVWVLAVMAGISIARTSAGTSSGSSTSHSSSYASSSHTSSSSHSSSRISSSHTAHKPDCGHPPQKCKKPNEVFDECPVKCPPQECGVNIAVILCPVPPKPGSPDCEPGCRCADGYLRTNSTGVCIPKDKCPKCTQPNELYDECLVTCPPQNCNVDTRLIKCAAPLKPGDPNCQAGCRCIDNYLRDSNGVCIPKEKCPPKCGYHEVYADCPPAVCRPKDCKDVGYPIPCPDFSMQGCPVPPACICEEGYARNSDGECVPWAECPSCGGDPNAVSGCGQNCNKRCSNLKNTSVACPEICEYNGCDCKKGYYLNENTGKCVLPKDCPPTCRKNEVYNDCVNGGCDPRNCSQLGFPVKCVKIDPAHCIGGCACIDGYVRDDDTGKCIPKEECPSCGGDPNAKSGCGVNCLKHCSDINNPKGCPKICRVNACDCKDGYYYDDNTKICVLSNQCSPNCTGKHELPSNCINDICSPTSCSQIGFPFACAAVVTPPSKCKGGCYCEDGYVYDDKGICIPKKKCPSCGGDPNAESGCGICRKRCEDLNNKEPIVCKDKICEGNGCDCKKGYVLNASTGKCVLPKDCAPECNKPHEVYSNCINDMCGHPMKCSDLGNPIVCTANIMDPANCIGGCYCKDEYVYDDKGNCIPKTECPSCGGDPNAVSGCGNCVPRCQDVNKTEPIFCTAICYGNACDCKEGYVLDSSGKCVLPKDCVSCSGDHNAKPGCDEKCVNRCPGPKPAKCKCPKHSCECKDGFVFDPKIKKCVKPEYCTSPCGEYEVFSDCVNGHCGIKNCSQIGQDIDCAKIDHKYCKQGCLCEEGYLRDYKGKCIPKEKCTDCKKPNEIWDPCAPSCPPQTCESKGKKYNCPLQPQSCKGACRCKKGYLRNKNGDCIPEKDCPPICDQDEVYDECANGGTSKRNCSQINDPVKWIRPIKCIGECVCKVGYLRDHNGFCIPEKECYVCVDPNAEPGCGLHCNKNCDTIDKKGICPRIACPPKGCECKDGFYYNFKSGSCVTKQQCWRDSESSCNGDHNAVAGCGMNCGRLCSNFNSTKPVICSQICKVDGCDCRKGYVFDENKKKCVLPKHCTPKCKSNEVYDSCANGGCSKRNCSQVNDPEKCIRPKVCKGSCVCKKGYLRNSKGVCVPKKQCSKPHCPINEVYDKCPASKCTPQRCSQLGYPIPCNETCTCKPGCICKDDYVRNDAGICIPNKDCPSCGGDPNAVAGCGVNCGRLCSNFNSSKSAVCPLICKLNGCDCKKGFVFDENTKKCVRPKDCTRKCKKNEVYDSCANGGCSKRNCSQINEPEKCIRPKVCKGGCVCIKGYLRNSKGICVPENQCPPPKCKQYEVYDSCANGGCSKRNCSQINDPEKCIRPIKCIGGCVCQEGYLRNKYGVCIPEYECPRNCNRKNEFYDPCSPNCPPQTCETIDKAYSCPAIAVDPKPCKGSCRCKEGYWRNKIGECISKVECLKCNGTHEYFSCGGACDNVCANLDRQNQTHCPIVNIVCNKMCYCEKGYARNAKKICIPIKDCPAPCGKDEEYEECPSTCVPRNCSQLGFPIPCPPLNDSAPCPTSPACVCKYDYLKNDKGVCIPKSDCPACAGDPNAVSGCGHCGNRCSDYNKQVACPFICYVNSCSCKIGFLYDDNIKKCVRPKDCTPVCEANEVYSSCANGGCRWWKCSDPGEICIDPIKCEGGCICRDEYVRNSNGTCIPKDQCPKQCKGRHEVYNPCPSKCAKTCESLKQGYVCPNKETKCNCGSSNCGCDCVGACVCQDGYYRNAAGECITKEECSKCKGEDEFYSCRAPCDNVCATLDEYNQTHCPFESIECKCFCELGYARDKNNVCIPIDDCPEPRCGPNERYEEDPASACEPFYCSELGYPIHCPRTDIPTGKISHCICKFGYVRNKLGICIPKTDCSSCGGDPNAVSGCGNKCGKSCSDYNENVVCMTMCYPNGCDCKKGYVYHESCKKCVLPKDCPPSTHQAPPPTAVNKTEALARLNKGSIALTGQFLHQLLASKPNTNFVASATSLLIPLAQLAYFATDTTLEKLLRCLNLKNKDEIKAIFGDVIASYENQTEVEFELASKYYSNIGYPLSDAFQEFLHEVFKASGDTIDFSKNVEAARIINAWIEKQTRDKIKDLVSPDMFNGDTRLVLANAIYFLGNWRTQFNPNDTETKDFYLDDTHTVQMPIMSLQNNFNYCEDDDLQIQALEMPYKNSNFSYLVLLPRAKGVNAVKALAEKLLDAEVFIRILEKMKREKVQVYMPRSTISTDIDVAEILKKAVQKAYIKTDETGSEAAAATVLVGATTTAVQFPPPEIFYFIADHPLLMYILKDRVPIFCGAIVGDV